MITRGSYSKFINVYGKGSLKCYDCKYSINKAFTNYASGTHRFPEWLEGEFIVDYTYLKRRT